MEYEERIHYPDEGSVQYPYIQYPVIHIFPKKDYTMDELKRVLMESKKLCTYKVERGRETSDYELHKVIDCLFYICC